MKIPMSLKTSPTVARPGGHVVDRGHGARYPADRQDGAEKRQPPTGSRHECAEQVARLRELVLRSAQRLGHTPDADADRRDQREPLERRKVDALRVVRRQAQERQPCHPAQRPLPPCETPLDRLLGPLSGPPAVAGWGRRLPLVAGGHEVRSQVITRKIVAPQNGTDPASANYRRLAASAATTSMA
jgi:hypothetical protein